MVRESVGSGYTGGLLPIEVAWQDWSFREEDSSHNFKEDVFKADNLKKGGIRDVSKTKKCKRSSN